MTPKKHADRLLNWWGIREGNQWQVPMDEMRGNMIDALRNIQHVERTEAAAKIERLEKWLDDLLNTHQIERMEAVVEAARACSSSIEADDWPEMATLNKAIKALDES